MISFYCTETLLDPYSTGWEGLLTMAEQAAEHPLHLTGRITARLQSFLPA
jgi:hypothetical protein